MSNQTPPGGDHPNQPNQWNQPSQGSQNPYASQGDGQGQPQGYSDYQQHQQHGSSGGSGMAITALVLGIIALLFSWTVIGGFLFGLIAIILGAIASSKAKKGQASGRGMAIGGIVTGVLGILIAGAITAFTAFLFSSAGFGSFTECVNNADGQSQLDECEREFEQNLEERFGG